MKQQTPKIISELTEYEVFVFGSNVSGFHGAGLAGWAMLHVFGNQWRSTYVPHPDTEIKRLLPELRHGEKGYWAQKGIARGIQRGWYGKSYAIQTVTRPGKRRSVPLSDIRGQLQDLCVYAHNSPLLRFYIPQIGTGAAGYSCVDIEQQFSCVFEHIGRPKNLYFLWRF